MDIETKKSFSKLKHYLISFNNAIFDKDHMWILYELPTEPKLYWIDNKAILDMDYLQWM